MHTLGHTHPNLTPIYGYAVDESSCFMVIPLMHCGTLQQRLFVSEEREREQLAAIDPMLANAPPLTALERAQLLRDVTSGLLHLHAHQAPLRPSQPPHPQGRGHPTCYRCPRRRCLPPGTQVLHRDVKPTNVGIDRISGRLRGRLMGFGFSKHAPSQDMLHPQLVTRLAGTEGYLEQTRLSEGYTPEHDGYSLGMTLLVTVTGRRPSTGLRQAAANTNAPQPPAWLPTRRAARSFLRAVSSHPLSLHLGRRRRRRWRAPRSGGKLSRAVS